MPDITPGPITASPPQVPVRDAAGKRLSLDMIHAFVLVALDHARKHPSESFHVKQDGWGYPHNKIAPMFDRCPANIHLPYGFIY